MDKQEMNSQAPQSLNGELLGDYLKEQRINKNYTLEKLSQKTKISVNILKALESNDYGSLPSAAYIKGFVTSYVKILGLPLEEAITRMESTYLSILGKPFPALNHTKNMAPLAQPTGKSTENREEGQTPHDVIESSDSIIESTKSVLPVAVFGAIILIFVGGYKMISSVIESEVNTQKQKDLGPRIESSSALVKQNDGPKVASQKASDTNAQTDGKSITPGEPPTAETTAKTPEFNRNYPDIEFKKIKTKLFNVKTDAPENDDETILPKQIKDSMNPEVQNVYIRASEGNTWMSYKIDNRPIESVIIKKGNDLFLQGDEIRIFLGNVGVTKIFYNNYLIDTPTKSGVKSLIFPEESNSKFSLPLFPKAKDDILYTSEDYQKRMKVEEEELEKRKEN